MNIPTPHFLQTKPAGVAYRYWIDRATPYYIATRTTLLRLSDMNEVGAFCAFQTIENVMKGALYFHREEARGHDLQILSTRLSTYGLTIDVPDYFGGYQSIARYPESANGEMGSGLTIHSDTVKDVDKIVYEIITGIGDKGPTRLKNLLESDPIDIDAFKIENDYLIKLQRFYYQ